MHPATRMVIVVALAAGCSWFEELQSADSADDSGSSSGTDDGGDDDDSGDSGSSGTGGGPCTIEDDDRCTDQDTLQSCDEASGDITVSSCTELCGESVNFSCVIATAEVQHGCWCVVPGKQKNLTCVELEACLLGCTDATSTDCADACFTRTDGGTIRTYGALVSCAHHECDDTCRDDSENCGTCISGAIMSGTGGCVLERSVCDADASSDPWWPD